MKIIARFDWEKFGLNIRVCGLLIALLLSPKMQAESFTIGTSFNAVNNVTRWDNHTLYIRNYERKAVPFETTTDREDVLFRVEYAEFRVQFLGRFTGKQPTPKFSIYDNSGTRGTPVRPMTGDAPGKELVVFSKNRLATLSSPYRLRHEVEKEHDLDDFYLKPNTKYWMVWSVRTDSSYYWHWYNAESRKDKRATTGLWEPATYNLTNDRKYRKTWGWHYNGTGDTAWSNRTPQFLLKVTPVLDYANGSELLVNNISTNTSSYRWAGGEKNRRAASFFTQDNYYGTAYRVHSVVLHYNEENPHYGTSEMDRRWAKPELYADALTGKSRVDTESGDGLIGSFSNNEMRDFKASNDFVRLFRKGNINLQPNRTYWLIFDTGYSGGTSEYPDYTVYNKFFTAKDTREHSPVGWKIGDDEMFSSNEGRTYRWANPHNTPPLQFGILAYRDMPDAFEIGDTLSPGNLAEPNVSFSGNERNRGINNDRWVATRFWTISTGDTPPHKFRLNHVTMLNNIRSYQNYNDGNHVIAIYDDDSSHNPSVPGREIGRFSQDLPEIIQGNFEGSIESDGNQQHRFHANPNAPILLDPWTRYWIVQKMENWDSGDSAVTHLGVPSFTRSKNADGWSFGDYYFRSYNRGRNWLEVNQVHGAHNDWTMRFGFGATVVVDPEPGDINVDGSINVFDLVLINDHARYLHPLPQSVFYLGNLNAAAGSSIINHHDRNLLLDLILEK